MDTVDTVDTVDTGDAVDTGDTVDTVDGVDTGDTVDSPKVAPGNRPLPLRGRCGGRWRYITTTVGSPPQC